MAIGTLSTGLGTAIGTMGKVGGAIGQIPFGKLASGIGNNIGLLGKVGAVGAAAFVGWQIGSLIRDIGGVGAKLDELTLKLFGLKESPGLGDIVASPEDQAAIQRAFVLMQKGLIPQEAIDNVADAHRILNEYNASLREAGGASDAAAQKTGAAGNAAGALGDQVSFTEKELAKFNLGQQSIVQNAAMLDAAL